MIITGTKHIAETQEVTDYLTIQDATLTGDPTKYMFEYVGRGNCQINIINSHISNFKRFFHAFFNDEVRGRFNVNVKGCTFSGIEQGVFLIRQPLNGFEISDCVFMDGGPNYNHAINCGFMGYGSGKVLNNTFKNLTSPEEGGQPSYVSILYGNNATIAYNTFENCTRGAYVRGNGGKIISNVFNTDVGRLPCIFKGGDSLPHIMEGNRFFGTYNQLALHDSPADWKVHNNGGNFNLTFHGFEAIMPGSQRIEFCKNSFYTAKDSSHITLKFAKKLTTLHIEENYFEEIGQNAAAQFISANGNLRALNIINNILKTKSLAYTSAKAKNIIGNSFLDGWKSPNFFRNNGGQAVTLSEANRMIDY